MTPAFRFAAPLLFLLVAQPSCGGDAPVKTGAGVLLASRTGLLEGKRVGLITNQTGRLVGGGMLVDSLLARGIRVSALFSPEHGIRGTARAGESVRDTVDAPTGLPVYSLHGKIRKPTPDMLAGLDLLLYDIQDVGVRFYTYISTMMLCMEAAAGAGIPFVVLDRPNPLGGNLIDGPLLEDSLRSFVGMVPVPVVYSLTCGELAMMINGEKWLRDALTADLTVIPMEGWKRSMLWDDTGLPWVPPSPNIPSAATTLVYPATCFMEATNVSEGRGTVAPFETIGAPFVDGMRFPEALRNAGLSGTAIDTISFIPTTSKYSGLLCHGVRVSVTDPARFQPVQSGLTILHHFLQIYPDSVVVNRKALASLVGSSSAVRDLISGHPPQEIFRSWAPDIDRFRATASRYLLYQN